VHINSLDYHLRRHEMAGDDVKHKQDKEYERSVEEEILKRTRKEAEQRAVEEEKLKVLEEAELSELVKQSKDIALEGISSLFLLIIFTYSVSPFYLFHLIFRNLTL
jgi:hypothetical protein